VTDARVQKDTELSDSEDEGMGGRRHRQNHNETHNAANGKRKGKATQSPTGSLSRRSKRPGASAGSRDSSLGPSVPPKGPQVTADSATAAEAPITVSTGAIVPTSTLADDDAMDVDPQEVDAELQKIVETGQIDNVGTTAKPPTEQPVPPAATPQTAGESNVTRPPAFASDSILPVGKLASEVGEDTPEPSGPPTEIV
jgi:histone deacetylase 1/2